MQLKDEILKKILEDEVENMALRNLAMNATDIVESECYQALQKIKAIIEDDSLEDSECFLKIEQIVCIFEELGSNGGIRHDFG